MAIARANINDDDVAKIEAMGIEMALSARFQMKCSAAILISQLAECQESHKRWRKRRILGRAKL